MTSNLLYPLPNTTFRTADGDRGVIEKIDREGCRVWIRWPACTCSACRRSNERTQWCWWPVEEWKRRAQIVEAPSPVEALAAARKEKR